MVLVLAFFLMVGALGAQSPGYGPDYLSTYYHDLLDFMRTQSLGRKFETPASERMRVATLVAAAWHTLDPGYQSTLAAIAEEGRTIGNRFGAMSQAEKDAYLSEARKRVLSPLWLYAPLADAKVYSNQGISFAYPSSWPFAQAQNVLFLGPSLPSTWEQANAPEACPPGMLAVAYDNVTNGMSYLDLAKMAASQYLPGLGEVVSFGSEAGAVVAAAGAFPGQREEKFFWLALVPCGKILVMARLGGPVDQLASLAPVFSTILNTISYKDPYAEPGKYSAAFDMAWNRVSTAIVKDIWAK
jgi:hypothetical protein